MHAQYHRRLLALVTTGVLVAVFAASTAQALSDRSSLPRSGTPEEHAQAISAGPASASPADFPLGTATPSEVCGACHKAIYREFATGFGSDLQYQAILYRSPEGDRLLGLPANVSAGP